MRKRLLLALLIASTNNFAQGINQEIASYMDNVFPSFAVSDNIFCSPANQTNHSVYPHVNYLLNVASAQNIVVFVHGFVINKNEGKYDLSEMVDIWKYHIDQLEEIESSTSYCVVTWDTEYGFDDKDATLARFLSIMNFALRKNYTASQARKNITLVGHSAGGNYIKYAYVNFLDLLATQDKSSLSALGAAYKFHIVTLDTPHLGVMPDKNASSDTATHVVQLMGFLMGDYGALNRPIVSRKEQTRGANQLKEIEHNDALYELNRQFSKVFPKREFFALASGRESTLTENSAMPPFTKGFKFNFEPKFFMQPFQSGALSSFLKIVYQGKHPGAKDDKN